MLEHWGDKAKIIHFSCDLRTRRSEGFIDSFTWKELEIIEKGSFLVGCLVTQKKTVERGSGRYCAQCKEILLQLIQCHVNQVISLGFMF